MGGGDVALVDEPEPQAARAVREDGRVLHGAAASGGGDHRAKKGENYLRVVSKSKL